MGDHRRGRTDARRRSVYLGIVIGMVVLAGLVIGGTASAQTTACPAGARGGSAGAAGRSTPGNGGLAFTVGGFGTTGPASAAGGDGGSARGGDGGRGGSGTLPICNQNTNGVVHEVSAPADTVAASSVPVENTAAPAPAPEAGSGGAQEQGPGQMHQAAYGTGGGLPRTGAFTNVELGIAGFAFVLGGLLLFVSPPAKQFVLRLVGVSAPPATPDAGQDWQVLGWSPPFRD